MDSRSAWRIMLLWYGAVLTILSIAREWSVVAFGFTYGLIFGGFEYRYRHKVLPFFQKIGLDNYLGFLLLASIVTVTEETYCNLLGCQIAHPVLWIDLALVVVMWTVWFGTWYFYLSKKYAFSEKEALMTASFTGIFYEFMGKGELLANPLGLLIATPLVVVVYAAIFILPMQLIEFAGKDESKWKYPICITVPYILTIPVAVALFVVFSLLGTPLT
jgi:hypothetical protein